MINETQTCTLLATGEVAYGLVMHFVRCDQYVLCDGMHRTVNTLRPKQNGWHVADGICKCIFEWKSWYFDFQTSLKFPSTDAVDNRSTIIREYLNTEKTTCLCLNQCGFYYSGVIMSAMASQISGVWSVCSSVRGIHRWPVNSLHKGPVTRKMFPFDDVIMCFDDIYLANIVCVLASAGVND